MNSRVYFRNWGKFFRYLLVAAMVILMGEMSAEAAEVKILSRSECVWLCWISDQSLSVKLGMP